MDFFEMRWPVLDPVRPPADLIGEAMADLAEELPALGLRPLSAPVWSWIIAPKINRHAGPFLVARFAVQDVGRLGQI
jgi:hypothetical protein